MSMDIEKSRAEFEEWVRSELHKGNERMAEAALARKMFPDDESRYRQVWVDAAWTGWKASRAVLVVLPPTNCRQRLAAEGKPYPRSSCSICGKFSPKHKQCDEAIAAAGIKVEEQA